MSKRVVCVFAFAAVVLFPFRAQGQVDANLSRFASFPAVSGHEGLLAQIIEEELKELSPKTDNLGNVIVTIGTGAPHRLLATAIDEPGYVVSGITPDGYLRVQRLPQAAPNGAFDTLHFAQPVKIWTRSGKFVHGVFAGLSVHLAPGRQDAPKMNHPDEMYVDIGATSEEEVRKAGVDLLDPVALSVRPRDIGPWMSAEAGPAVGDRFGAAVLKEIAAKLGKSKTQGTTTIAFVTQSWTGGRGLNRLLEEIKPDEMIYLGRIATAPTTGSKPETQESQLGSGVLLAVPEAKTELPEFPAAIQKLAAKRSVPLTVTSGAPPRIASYTKPNPLPARFAMIGVPTLWPVTPAETVSSKDLKSLEQLIEEYLGFAQTPIESVAGGVPGGEKSAPTLQTLVETYGASGHEDSVRDAVKKLLGSSLAKKTETDEAGNLILHFGDGGAGTKTPRIAFVAHMDEIGYQVRSIENDGRLLVDVLGGGYEEYFLGHVALVHSAQKVIGGVMELPDGWEKPGFEWPRGAKMMNAPVHVYVGTHSAEDTQKLGIKIGDWITIPKEYRPLQGTRANGRSFDDRVGCTALIEAAKLLGSDLPLRDVTFIWSTEEELGLKGAAAAAERMAKEGKAPDFVFAIDTFVSSDSPLESKRFADTEIGKGFVLRAVDNSNITPIEYVDRVVKLARENNIPVQYGVTGGGNDGSVFPQYGSVDIPLSWALRYAHSPGEVIDTRDVDALSKIVAVLAKEW